MRSNHETGFVVRSVPPLSMLNGNLGFRRLPRLTRRATPSPALLILSKQDRALGDCDPGTLKAVARICRQRPHEVVASSTGKTALVSNYGFGAYHTLGCGSGRAKAAARDRPGCAAWTAWTRFSRRQSLVYRRSRAFHGQLQSGNGRINWVMGIGQNRTHMIYVFAGRSSKPM